MCFRKLHKKISLLSLKLNLPVRVPFPIANSSLLKYLCLANLLFRAPARIPTSCTLLGQSSIPSFVQPTRGDRREIFKSSLRGNIMRRRNISQNLYLIKMCLYMAHLESSFYLCLRPLSLRLNNQPALFACSSEIIQAHPSFRYRLELVNENDTRYH